jgi:hypothetical protein
MSEVVVFVRDGGDIMSTVGSEVVVFVRHIFLSQYNDITLLCI